MSKERDGLDSDSFRTLAGGQEGQLQMTQETDQRKGQIKSEQNYISQHYKERGFDVNYI